MSQEKKSEAPEKNDQAHKLDAIKEIIFGEQIKEYDSEFKELKELIQVQKTELVNDINTMKVELETLMGQVKTDFYQALEAFKSETAEKFNGLDHTKTNRVALADMLEELARKLKA